MKTLRCLGLALALGVLTTEVLAEEVRLTLDPKVQAALEAAMRKLKGAAVIMDVQNGEVLGIVSNPCKIGAASRFSAEEWRSLMRDPKDSFLSGAIASRSPGASFLPVTALAALESGKITPETKFTCTGNLTIHDVVLKCWEKDGHGEEKLKQAMAWSCGLFFYQAGRATGIEALMEMAQRAGFGQPTGLVESESAGFLPTREQMMRYGAKPSGEMDAVNAAIGQGLVNVTPIQMTVFMSALANGGTLLRPRLIKSDAEGVTRIVRSTLDVAPDHLRVVRESMLAVVEEGTGKRARVEGVKVAGRTGTSQFRSRDEKTGNMELVNRAWFSGFAPYESPKYAFCILVNGGVSGGATAGPVVHEVLSQIYLKAP